MQFNSVMHLHTSQELAQSPIPTQYNGLVQIKGLHFELTPKQWTSLYSCLSLLF